MPHDGTGSNNHIDKKTDSIKVTKNGKKKEENYAKRKRGNVDVMQNTKKASCFMIDNDAWRTLQVKVEPMDLQIPNDISLSWLADERVCQVGLTKCSGKEDNVPVKHECNNFSEGSIVEAFVKIETSVTRTEKPDGDCSLGLVAVGMDAGSYDLSPYQVDFTQFQLIAASVEELKKLVTKFGALLLEKTRVACINKKRVDERKDGRGGNGKKDTAREDNITPTMDRVAEVS